MHKIIKYEVIGLIIIFIAALAVRLYPVVNSPEQINKGFGPFGDANLYHIIAYNLYKGNGFSGIDDGTPYGLNPKPNTQNYEPAINRGPAYPSFIFLVYKLFADPEDMKSLDSWHRNWHKVRIAQCVLDSLVCILVFFIVRLILPSSLWPAFISATIYVFSFYNIFYTKTLLSESVTTFLLALALLLFIWGLRTKNKAGSFLGGVGLGILVLSRTEYVLFIGLLAGFIFLANRKQLSIALKKSAVFILGAFIVISPWLVRNYIIFKQPVVTIGALGYNMYLGTFETNDNWAEWGEFPDEIFTDKQEKEQVYSLYESFHQRYSEGSIKVKELDDCFLQLARQRISQNPLQTFKIWTTRIPRLWYQNYIPMYAYVEASGWFFVFYFVFAILAFILSSAQERTLIAPIGFLFIYLTLIFLPLHIEPRYGVALMPGIISLAGIGVWKLFLRLKGFLIKNKLIDFASE